MYFEYIFICHYCSRSYCCYFDVVPSFVVVAAAVAAAVIVNIPNYYVDDTHIVPSFPSRPWRSFLPSNAMDVVVVASFVFAAVVVVEASLVDTSAVVVVAVVLVILTLTDMHGTMMPRVLSLVNAAVAAAAYRTSDQSPCLGH